MLEPSPVNKFLATCNFVALIALPINCIPEVPTAPAPEVK